MNVVNNVNKAEIAMMHAVLNNKFGPLYADNWKVVVNSDSVLWQIFEVN